MTINILADSACDLPLSYFSENNLTFIPLNVHLEGKDYEDGINIQSKTVYDAMRQGAAPKTSQASPEFFLETFTELAKQKKQAIYVAFSSELSGTYQTAVMIKEQVKADYPDLDLTIIDTKCASLGYGLVVKRAVELAKTSASKEEIIDKLNFHAKHMVHLFTVDNLEYLARGGRISKASAFVGGLLNIRPLLHVDDGKLVPLEKIHGKKKLVKRTLELMKEHGAQLAKQTIGISHGDDLKAANDWKEAISKEFGTTSFDIELIGSTVGAHAGPGTIAIFFLDEMPVD
ncbi:DegV family protein [Bacillus massiliigorillae]|uniref:DegV family protein n=1 Tax=Bacillus massiliigorillae TaxID=1243664 RepID=UPI0003A2ED54|nr:DegV family protein [Bacillus massiliigorillae]